MYQAGRGYVFVGLARDSCELKAMAETDSRERDIYIYREREREKERKENRRKTEREREQKKKEAKASPQKTGPGSPLPPQSSAESLGLCRRDLQNLLHARKPAEDSSHRTPKVLQNFGSQAQLFRPFKFGGSLFLLTVLAQESPRQPNQRNGQNEKFI